MALEDYSEAIKDFSKSIQLNPEGINAYRNRGTIKEFSEDLKGAKLDFRKAGELGDEEAKQWSEDII